MLLTLLAASSSAKDDPQTSGLQLPKGLTMWGLSGNVGFPTGDRVQTFGSVLVGFERVATDPGGPGWLRGRLGFSVELVPMFLLSEGTTTYGAGFNLLGRHYLSAGRAIHPFITLGAGLILSNDEIPQGVAKLNFTPQLGFGFLFSDKRAHAYSVELRFHHLSNGGRVSPNPGINSVLVQFGIRFHRAITAAPSARQTPSFH